MVARDRARAVVAILILGSVVAWGLLALFGPDRPPFSFRQAAVNGSP